VLETCPTYPSPQPPPASNGFASPIPQNHVFLRRRQHPLLSFCAALFPISPQSYLFSLLLVQVYHMIKTQTQLSTTKKTRKKMNIQYLEVFCF
jgi:hypothetical protein